MRSLSVLFSLIFVLTVISFSSRNANAQMADAPAYNKVVSANPFGLLLDLFNDEYERVVAGSATAGIGGSAYFGADDKYVNADVFWRFYPQGAPLNGWAFGVKVGLTTVDDQGDFLNSSVSQGTYFGAGFDLNRSWVMGKNDNFYVGTGFGLKRLFGAKNAALEYIPTFRIVNVGYVF